MKKLLFALTAVGALAVGVVGLSAAPAQAGTSTCCCTDCDACADCDCCCAK